ncbi:MAG: MBL fold metallo-hydrolase [Clostridia bacterium]|nr:MBL fold metallo-hydrolase [Clostridia bacterium]
MSRICPLFSGSKANSTYIGTRAGGILVDAGASLKGMEAALQSAGGSLEEIIAVAVTHEHTDHIKGLKTLLNKTNARLIASQQTLEALRGLDRIPAGTRVEALEDGALEVGGIALSRFATSHDCEGSGGYTFILPDGKKVAVCTDLGVVTDEVRSAISGSDLVLLESNHDVEMLKRGPYPPLLKLRILSDTGHISNATCAAELAGLLKGGATRFILGHLSQNNNTPELARGCAEAALMDIGARSGKDYILSVAAPTGNGVIVL